MEVKKQNIKLTNSEWIDFLTEQFEISRTSAKKMLHKMMEVKKEDNFKKQLTGNIEKRPKGKWVGIAEYCKHLEEETGERYQPSGLSNNIYCNQCWSEATRKNGNFPNYCPNCGEDMRGVDK